MKKTAAGFILLTALVAALLIIMGAGRRGFYPDIPLTCSGGDDTSYLSEIKMMSEGSFLRSDILGAPFGTNRTGLVSSYLKMDVDLLSFIFLKITGSIGAAVNLAYFTLFFLAAQIAYLVLRSREIRVLFSILGALSYAFLPYIYSRRIGHLMLSAVQFIPLAILLCIWIFEDDRLFIPQKGFLKYRRNLIAVLFAALIASNGMGYYPFFSCMILLMAGISKAVKKKQAAWILQSAAEIILIILFMALYMSPYILGKLTGTLGEGEHIRQIGDAEQFCLKIARLFIPTYGTGADRIDRLISDYASVQVANWPAEATEYIGLIGSLGFFVLIFALLLRFKEGSRFKELELLSELNVCMLLYGSIGGFSVFVFFLLTMSVRCTNRISVFIAFASVLAFFLAADRLCPSFDRSAGQKEKLKAALIYIFVICLTAGGLFLQTRTWSFSNESWLEPYLSREEFVENIENVMPEGSMVYQLPFCSYPEGGIAEKMNADMQFFPYLHSETLRWSYGALRGERSLKLNSYLCSLENEQMLKDLCLAGYRGLFINRTGYSDEAFEQLNQAITALLDDEAIVSADGTCYFHDLTDYAGKLKSTMTEEEWEKERSKLLSDAGL